MTKKYESREERRKRAATKKTPVKGKTQAKVWFKRIFLGLVALGIVGLLAGIATFAYLVKDTPELDVALLKDPISSNVLDMDGNFIRELGVVRRDFIAYEDIPEVMVEAVLATEDARFFKHSGIDVIRLGGAVIANFRDGFGSEGASTITQQLVKNSFLNKDKKLKRKVQEAWLSVQLERKYTKEEIFEMYVNKNNMGGNVHGIATAAKVYYDKDLADVTVEEAAMLAGLFQSPNRYHPFKHPDKAETRRNIVLSLMNYHGFLSEEDMKAAQTTKVVDALVPEDKRIVDLQPYDSFIDHVIKEVEELSDYNIFTDGLTVYTTLNTSIQGHVDKVLDSDEFIDYPDEDFQAGISLLDTRTGAIRALGGGRNQTVQRAFNFATDIERQPGSTIKPILDYGPAIEYLKWSTYKQLDDKPYTYSDGTKVNNWDNLHQGQMSAREALKKSRNIPAIQALQAVGLDKAQEFAGNIGIPLDEIYEPYAIGGFKTGVSPLQMSGAYSAFGNKGVYTEPYSVVKIELRDGTVIHTVPDSEVAMRDYTAFMITDMLKDVVSAPGGTGGRANIPGLHLAGKTGTTNYTGDERNQIDAPNGAVPDAWFVGYTTNYTTAVWTGYSERKNYLPPGPSQRIAQEIFKEVMTHASKDIDTPDFTMPQTVVKIGVEKGSDPAKLPGPLTPSNEIVYEYFVVGTEPKETSEKFEELEAPIELQALYEEDEDQINLTWDYNRDDEDDEETDVTFEVFVSINDGPEKSLLVTPDYHLTMGHPERGAHFRFKVVAIVGELTSDPASVELTIPEDEPVVEEPLPEETPPPKNEGQENGETLPPPLTDDNDADEDKDMDDEEIIPDKDKETNDENKPAA